MKNTQEIENALREGETIFPCGGCKKNIFAKVKIEKAIVVCPYCSHENNCDFVHIDDTSLAIEERYKLTDLAEQLISENEDGDIILRLDDSGTPKHVIYSIQGFYDFSQGEIIRIARGLMIDDYHAEKVFNDENKFDFTDEINLITSCKSGKTWPLDIGLVEKVQVRKVEKDNHSEVVSKTLPSFDTGVYCRCRGLK